MMTLDITDVARSLELYCLGVRLQQEAKRGKTILEFTREPSLRDRKDVGKVVVAFGSYDPLSCAHEALFLQGLDVAKGIDSLRAENGLKSLEELVIVTSTSHFEKKIDLRKNAAVYDRIHAQEGFASCFGRTSLAFFNDPYFVNLKKALQEKYSPQADLYFLVGADVMEKVVDLQEYERRGLDGKGIVEELLEHHFIVSQRQVAYKDRPMRVVTSQMIIEENPILHPYAGKIIGITLSDDYRGLEIPIWEVSSSMIREKRNRGEDVARLAAVGISDFVDKHSLYLEDNAMYEAYVCLRQMFADHYLAQGVPIGRYISGLMTQLGRMEKDGAFACEVIKNYHEKKFPVEIVGDY